MLIFVAATWVGGGFVVGVAESVYDPTKGLIWALIPLQDSISFIIGKCAYHHWRSQFAIQIKKEA